MSPARLRVLGMLLLACLLPARLLAAEREGAREPRLILAGSHAVQAGEVVTLEWTGTEGVAEMEILMSLDGGRTYPIWISPRLRPDQRRFVWRVPAGLGPNLRMRIRYNRQGREIEGAPIASLAVVDSRAAQPLGLPGSPEDSARPASGGDREGRGAARADGAGRQDAPEAPASGPRAALHPQPSPASAPLHDRPGPAFVPLRA